MEKLVERNEYGIAIITACSTQERDKKIQALAEYYLALEDKLESGQLVELPCIAGDTIYLIVKNKIVPALIQIMEQHILEKGDTPHYGYYMYWFDGEKGHHRNLSLNTLGIKCFINEFQAEARLKELKEKL